MSAMNLWRYKLRTSCGIYTTIQKCCLSSSSSTEAAIEYRNRLYDNEKKRQKENLGRIEKIEVRYLGLPKDDTLIMNKGLSTPFNCAQHFSETLCNNSVVALINGKKLWDIHRPLEESCTLQLLNFRSSDPFAVNHVFWRSCSFILGAVLQRTLKDSVGLFLHSFPKPNVRSGSFIYDFALSAENWTPSIQELKSIGIEMMKFVNENDRIERLEVNHDLALQMFKDNPFKREQLPSISNKNNGIIPLYRVGDHIDISKGPMIASTKFVAKASISAVHKISRDDSNLYRIQGIALPTGFTISSFAFNILNERAKKLNSINLHMESADPDHTLESHQQQQQRI